MFQPTAASPPLPTSFLPPLKLLDALSAASISLTLAQLKQLYQPLHIQPSHYRRLLILEPAIDSGYASDDEYTPMMTSSMMRHGKLRDFVSRSPSDHEAEDRERVVDAMIAFLGSLAQTSEAGDLHREFVFNLHPNANVSSTEVNVVLKDVNLSSTDHTSVGLQTWASQVMMIERICDNPASYGIVSTLHESLGIASQGHRSPLRILELGAGTGLLSLVLGNVLRKLSISATIVSTDFHPDVLSNLRANVASNPSSSAPRPEVKISVEALDWQYFFDHQEVDTPLNAPFDEPFDIIVAADHAEWISCTVRRLLRRPSLSSTEGRPRPAFHLISPIRPTHLLTSSSIEEAFPSSLEIVEVKHSARSKSVGRADENGYVEYKIEWNC
ncbi:hypothetical protein BS47DRAFT_1351758 [Hydnum rufescens UP504]|uniref:S-adenosylmethionine-dependent methyltransferase n=1 Tax=Hydnum rufescens UP504 TaxID=1448309 RepID=A0A9P6AKC9_9AGAM|nr:hypothetical protein BS47DRAFT_1351758 [Hydnum rufescens UP504]